MPIITVNNLKYKYPGTDKLVINDVSFEVNKGEFIGIIGRNGAGKSTLSQAIIGLVPQFYNGAYGGRVMTCGLEADKTPVSVMCEHVGLVFQNPFTQLSSACDSVYAEVAYGLQNLGIEREEIHKRVDSVLKQLDIYEYRNRNPYDLSGGQMQRVAIASILVMQPEIIILDEPTSQLDPQGAKEVFSVVDALAKSGKTVIMIEQKIEKIAQYCDRIMLMDEGKILCFDKPEVVLSRDDLYNHGVEPPVFTRVCRANNLSNEAGTYPTTLEDTIKLFNDNNKKLTLDFNNTSSAAKYKSLNLEITPTFTINNLDFSYTSETGIFSGLNLKLDNRPTAIIGQNGAGKTSLVRLLKGLLKPIGGNIYYGSDDISKRSVASLASKVGYVFQNPDDQIFKYTVLDEVMFGPLMIGHDKDTAKANALKAMNTLKIADKAQVNPYDLELNERKLVAIASVLAMDTDVIILDEPTIAQDYEGKKLISEMINTLANSGKSVIAILHDMNFVYDNFQRVIVMAHGKILLDNDADTVFSNTDVLNAARLQKPDIVDLYERLK